MIPQLYGSKDSIVLENLEELVIGDMAKVQTDYDGGRHYSCFGSIPNYTVYVEDRLQWRLKLLRRSYECRTNGEITAGKIIDEIQEEIPSRRRPNISLAWSFGVPIKPVILHRYKIPFSADDPYLLDDSDDSDGSDDYTAFLHELGWIHERINTSNVCPCVAKRTL
jgi:hypothetical protein